MVIFAGLDGFSTNKTDIIDFLEAFDHQAGLVFMVNSDIKVLIRSMDSLTRLKVSKNPVLPYQTKHYLAPWRPGC